MKPIKCWIATDDDDNTYTYRKKPTKECDMNFNECWTTNDGSGTSLGRNLVDKEKPVKCIIITEEEYKKLKEVVR